jgi:hypothetical protein
MRRHAISALQRWIEKGGGSVSRSIEIVERESGVYSLRATKPIKPFEVILQIPFEFCLIENYGAPTEECPDPEGLAEVSLARALLKEKQLGGQSKHSLFLRTMPTNIDSFPQSWNKDMWTYLENTTLHAIHTQREKRQRLLWKLCPKTFLSEEDERWAECMVTSRSVSLDDCVALVPLIDLCDHDDNIASEPLGTRGCAVLRGKRAPGFPHSINGYSLVSFADHSPGADILRSYGDLSFEDKICEFGWLDRERRLAAYSTMKLALPLVAQHQLYGPRLKYKESLCTFSGLHQHLFASVCLYLQKENIARGTFTRGLKRRLKELLRAREAIQQESAIASPAASSSSPVPVTSAPCTETAIAILPTQPAPVEGSGWSLAEQRVAQAAVLAMEVQKVEVLLLLVEREERYRLFLQNKLPQVLVEREAREAEESQMTQQLAMVLERETGLDLSQLLDGSDEFIDEEELERQWREESGESGAQ